MAKGSYKKTCPVCNKKFAPKGLPGHMKAHKTASESDTTIMGLKPDVVLLRTRDGRLHGFFQEEDRLVPCVVTLLEMKK